MKYVKADYFLNINSSKDKPSNNIKLFHNKISNNSLLRNNPEINNKDKIAILKKSHRPLSTTYSNNNQNNNKTKVNEFVKQNLFRNVTINKGQNSSNYSVNLKSIIDTFNSNNIYKLVNFHQKINGKVLEDLIIKNIISLPKINEKNKFFVGKYPISYINQSHESKNNFFKNKTTNYPNFIIENENKTSTYNISNRNNNNNGISFSNPQNTKILMYFVNKSNNSSIQNDKSTKNNSFIKNETYHNNTINSFLLKAITNNKVSKTNNSLIFSNQKTLNTPIQKQNNNNDLMNSKEMDTIIKENNMLIKSQDIISIKNNMNNINSVNNLRATFGPTSNIKSNNDINNNYFIKEEFVDKLNSVRKIYREREIKRQNLKCFYYLILPGNASYLVEKCMNHRINWMKPFSKVTTLFNFKWQELSYGIDYDSLGHFQNIKQIVNHYENHFVISNKAKMFTNLLNYCEKRKISVFKFLPFTIVFQLKEEKPKKTENEKEKKNNIINNNNINNNNSNADDKYEKLKNFLNNANKYIVNYNELGKYYEKESFKKYVRHLKEKEKEKDNNLYIKDYKKISFRRKNRATRKFNKRKHLSFLNNQKKETIPEPDINNSNYTFYSNIFNNLIEDNNVPIYDKNKEFKDNNKSEEKNKVEPYIIGSNTIIEIPESHFTGKNMWVVKAVNLNRGMCIRIVNSYEQMIKVLNKFKEGVDYNFTKEKIEESETIPQVKNITNINNNNNSNNKNNVSVSPSKKAINNNCISVDKVKIIKKNITSNVLNSADKAKMPNSNSNSIINSFEKYNRPKNEEDKKNSEKEEKRYNCNKIIIQKYIENPLLYRGRKCDMRIWVLLTHEMKVYVFKEGHLKTCSIEYNLNSKDAFAHITNYSFQKYNKNFQKYEKGNEVPFYEFQKFLDENYSERKYNLKIELLNQIKDIVKITMRSAKDTINKKKRNFQFEIFGYDFMMDKDFNLFLIEINTNPGLEESSPWIKLIVPRMLDDALRLTIDQLFETKYDFNLINKNKTKEEINNYKNLLNNYRQNIDINGINTSSSVIIKNNIKIDEKSDNHSYLNTKPTVNEQSCESQEKGNKEKKDNDKNTIEKTDNKNIDNKNLDLNKDKKYISPFPIPGYTLDENIWELVCDLNEHDPLDDLIEKEEEEEISIENNKKNTNIGWIRRRKNKKGKKKKIKLNKNENNEEKNDKNE